MTLNLPAQEMEMLEALATKMDMTKTSVMRKALRMLDMIEKRFAKGKGLFFEDDQTRFELMVMFTSGVSSTI